MARITVEDCLENVENRFELVILASARARRLARFGEEPTVPWENDKPTVVALREIAEGNIKIDYLTKSTKPAQPEQVASTEEEVVVAESEPAITDKSDSDQEEPVG